MLNLINNKRPLCSTWHGVRADSGMSPFVKHIEELWQCLSYVRADETKDKQSSNYVSREYIHTMLCLLTKYVEFLNCSQ